MWSIENQISTYGKYELCYKKLNNPFSWFVLTFFLTIWQRGNGNNNKQLSENKCNWNEIDTCFFAFIIYKYSDFIVVLTREICVLWYYRVMLYVSKINSDCEKYRSGWCQHITTLSIKTKWEFIALNENKSHYTYYDTQQL